jgi:hypothetical protein
VSSPRQASEKRKSKSEKENTNVSLIAKKGTERMTDHPPYNTSRCCRSAFFLVVSEKYVLMSNWDICGVPQTKPLFLFFSRLDLSFPHLKNNVTHPPVIQKQQQPPNNGLRQSLCPSSTTEPP